jgi:hypothetical protein
MIRAALTLVIITLLVGGGVYFGADRLERILLDGVPAGKSVTRAAAGKKAPARHRKNSRRAPAIAVTAKQGFQIIVSRNIFEAALEKKSEPVKTKVEEEVKPTKLNLVLLGTVVGDENDARAIVVDKTANKQDIYRIGDAVQGALIESIGRGRITLDVNGKKESLLIKEREGGGPAAPGGQGVNTAMERRASAATGKKPFVKPHRRITFQRNVKPVKKIVPKAAAPAVDGEEAGEDLPDETGNVEEAELEPEEPLTQ